MEMEMKSKGDLAKEYFLQGYNCSQSVVLAFADELDMREEDIIKISSSFGAGMGRLREVCGAVSGMFMVAGALYGYDDPKDYEAKKKHYERIQYLGAQFKEENGSIVCRELLGLKRKTDEPAPEKRTESYYKKRPCADLVKCAADILEKYVREH